MRRGLDLQSQPGTNLRGGADLYQDVLIGCQGRDGECFNFQRLSLLNNKRFPFFGNSHNVSLTEIERDWVIRRSRIYNPVVENFRGVGLHDAAMYVSMTAGAEQGRPADSNGQSERMVKARSAGSSPIMRTVLRSVACETEDVKIMLKRFKTFYLFYPFQLEL